MKLSPAMQEVVMRLKRGDVLAEGDYMVTCSSMRRLYKWRSDPAEWQSRATIDALFRREIIMVKRGIVNLKETQ